MNDEILEKKSSESLTVNDGNGIVEDGEKLSIMKSSPLTNMPPSLPPPPKVHSSAPSGIPNAEVAF